MIDRADDNIETLSWKEHRVLVENGKDGYLSPAGGISISATIW